MTGSCSCTAKKLIEILIKVATPWSSSWRIPKSTWIESTIFGVEFFRIDGNNWCSKDRLINIYNLAGNQYDSIDVHFLKKPRTKGLVKFCEIEICQIGHAVE